METLPLYLTNHNPIPITIMIDAGMGMSISPFAVIHHSRRRRKHRFDSFLEKVVVIIPLLNLASRAAHLQVIQ
jgi:hypothetical protein